MQVEVKGGDTVRILKAMLQTELGIAEDQQELTFADLPLDDAALISDYGIAEGCTVVLAVHEDTALDAAAPEAPVAEECLRFSVKCDVTVSKSRTVKIDMPRSESMKGLKVKAYEAFTKISKDIGEISASNYGLFVLKSPTVNAKGQLRWLTREERLREDKTIEESNLRGDEEIVFANLFWLEG